MDDDKRGKTGGDRKVVTRRGFLELAGVAYVVVAAGSAKAGEPALTLSPGQVAGSEYPASEGYLVVDVKKCQGCLTCMLACSTANEGEESLSLSRIQVIQNPFERYPLDITMAQCRQCLDPACVKECPEGALHVDKDNGNVRTVDPEKCIGCQTCVQSCPHQPARVIWNFEKEKAQKCDLCQSAKYWNHEGRQACVESCPVAAIAFQKEIPVQDGDAGYAVNLRDEAWGKLGYSTD